MSSSESISGAESISEDSLPSSPRQLTKSRKEVDLEVRFKFIIISVEIYRYFIKIYFIKDYKIPSIFRIFTVETV